MGAVIKKEEVGERAKDAEPREFHEPSSRRLPEQRVRMRRPDGAASPSPPPRRVVPRDRANAAAPVMVETVELPEPDLPLPDGQAEPGQDEETEGPVDVETLKKEWDAEWEERLETAAEEARQEGYEAGYEAAREELEAEMDETRAKLTEDVQRLETVWQEFIEESKPLLAQLAVEVAEHVLDAELPDAVKGASGRAITQAVDELAGDEPLTLSLHPVDYLRLEEAGLTEQLEAIHPELQWDSDASLEEGDWKVQSPNALIRRLRSDLLQKMKQRLQIAGE